MAIGKCQRRHRHRPGAGRDPLRRREVYPAGRRRRASPRSRSTCAATRCGSTSTSAPATPRHRLRLRPHRRLRPHQRRLHDLPTLPPVALGTSGRESSQTSIWARNRLSSPATASRPVRGRARVPSDGGRPRMRQGLLGRAPHDLVVGEPDDDASRPRPAWRLRPASCSCLTPRLAWNSQPSHSSTTGAPTIRKSTSSPARRAWNSNGGSRYCSNSPPHRHLEDAVGGLAVDHPLPRGPPGRPARRDDRGRELAVDRPAGGADRRGQAGRHDVADRRRHPPASSTGPPRSHSSPRSTFPSSGCPELAAPA